MKRYRFRSDKDILLKRIYIFAAAVIFILVSVTVFYTASIFKKENTLADLYLQQTVSQTASNIRNSVKNDLNNLKILSDTFSINIPNYSQNEISNFLKVNVQTKNYYRLIFIYPDGKTIQYNKKNGLKYNDKNYDLSCAKDSLTGNPCFAGTIEDKESLSGFVNSYYMPVFNKEHNIIGVLGAEIDSDLFNKILELNNFNGKGSSHVIDSDGNYIIKSQNDLNVSNNFFDAKIRFLRTNTEKIQEDLKSKNVGSFRFKWIDGKKYIAAFCFIGNNNSFVLTNVPKDILMMHINDIVGIVWVLLLSIGTILLFLLKYTIFIYKQNEKVINNIVFADTITGKGNKNQFFLEANELLSKSKNEKYAVIAMEIRNFEQINQLLGTETTNKIIKDIYTMITDKIQKKSLCARDFSAAFIILSQYDDESAIISFLNKIKTTLKIYNEKIIPNYIEDIKTKVFVELEAKFGVYLIDNYSLTISQMYDNALYAKKIIKENSDINYKIYDDNIKAQIRQDEIIKNEMHSALENKQFKMYLQPVYDLNTKEIISAEALVRWHHPTRGIIPPLDFMSVFEKTGFIINLDKYIWRQACDFLALRKRDGKKLFPISVNISSLHLYNELFVEELINITKNYEIEPKFLEIEISEKTFIEHKTNISKTIDKLKTAGFKIVLDNFGHDFISLDILKQFSIEIIKLDRNYISNSISNENGTILKSVLKVLKQMNIQTIAAGIETNEQVEFLRNSECNLIQGFLYGRPLEDIKFIQTFLD